MKKIIFISLLLTISLSLFAQKTDFTTYDVIAKADDVTIIVKDNDYRMIVGSVKKPKLNMLVGYTKEQVAAKIDRILEFSNEKYTNQKRNVSFCGILFLLTITGNDNNEKFRFEASDMKYKFELTTDDCKAMKNRILQLE